MKKSFVDKIKIFMIIILLTLMISVPYLNFDDIGAHDISYHVNRIIEISNELKDGQFPVLIHSNLLNGFGYANSLFYPELFLYIPALLIIVGMDFLNSYKVFTIIVTFFTFLITFYSANRVFQNRKAAWITTILYGCSCYRLTNLYIRGAIGEVLAMSFLPLIVCGLYEIIFGENKKWWILCFGIFGIINSHILTFAMSIILILLICLINIVKIFKDKKRILNIFLAGIISILLTFSFVLPYLEQTNNDKFNVDEKIYNGAFLESYSVSLRNLINNDFTSGEEYKSIGLCLLIIPIFIVKCDKKNQLSKYIKQILILGWITLFISTNLFPWEELCNKFNSITTLQFPYRLNIVATVLLSFASGYVLCNLLNTKEEVWNLLYIILIIYILTFVSSLNTNVQNFTRDSIINLAPVGNGEYKPYGLIISDDRIYNITDKKEIPFERKGRKIEFNYSNDESEMIIHVPLTYYKGYRANIENNGEYKELTVSKHEETKNVLISSDEKLAGTIVVEYKMTLAQKIGYAISSFALFLLIIYSNYCNIKEYMKNKSEVIYNNESNS